MVNYTAASFSVSTDGLGGVGTITIVDGGAGYTNPFLEFSLPQVGGTQAIATASLDDNGSIIDVTIVYGGAGYFQDITLQAFDITGATLPTQGISGWDATPVLGNSYYLVDSNNLYTLFQNKQNLLAFDSQPSQDSPKVVTSGNIHSWVTQGLATKQPLLVYDSTAVSGSLNSMTSAGIYNLVNPIRSSLSSLTGSSVYSNVFGINAGVDRISDVFTANGNTQSKVFMLSVGGHSLDTTLSYETPNSCFLGTESAGAQATSVSAAITVQQGAPITNPMTRARFSSVQFSSLFTINGTAGRHYFRDVAFTGLSVVGACTGWLQFTDCDFTSGSVSIAATFGGYVNFIRCAFNGNPTLSFTANFTTIYAVFRDCSGLSSATIANGFLIGTNVVGVSTRVDATALYQNGSQVITSYDTSPMSASQNLIKSGNIYTALGLKQNTLVFDSVPTSGSANVLSSGTMFTALAGKASTSDITTAVANLVNAAPSTLNTLSELAQALGNDANFSTTVTNSIALKAPLASPTFTGSVTCSALTVNGVSITGSGGGSSFAPQQATFGTNGSLATGGSNNGVVINWNSNGTNNITGLTNTNGVFSLPAGTYVITFHCHLAATPTGFTIYFQTGSTQQNIGYNGTSNDIYSTYQGSQILNMTYSYVFLSSTTFRCIAGSAGTSTSTFVQRTNNLTITRIA